MVLLTCVKLLMDPIQQSTKHVLNIKHMCSFCFADLRTA